MKRLTYSLCALTALAALAAPAFAVDGVTLISQATVQAAGGFPYTISQPGSYRLSGNLAVSNAAGIKITAPQVTLDLNGFGISCSNCAGILQGIDANTVTGTTVVNGSVSGFTGICVSAGNLAQIDRVTVSNCNNGISVGSTSSVTNSTASNLAFTGISGDYDVSVVNCRVTAFHTQGIRLHSGTITGSAVTGPGLGLGAAIQVSSHAVVFGSTISFSSQGVVVEIGATANVTNSLFDQCDTAMVAQGTGVILYGSDTFQLVSVVGSGHVFSQQNNFCGNSIC